MDINVEFPRQAIPVKQKGDKWRRGCVDWASTRTYFNYTPVRKDVVNMKVNYDLVNGIIHMEDVAAVLNPGDLSTAFVPDKIHHYPIINGKLNTLLGEEAARVFDWRVVVTNPYAVSQMEEDKRRQFNEMVLGSIEGNSENPQEEIRDGVNYFNRKWQDWREIRGNELLKHYSKEQNFKQIFNDGFLDASASGSEVYQVAISGGEPVLTKLNPMKLRVFGGGYSNRIEDYDVIIYEDYWSKGRILDTYGDELSTKDVKWISDETPDFSGSGPVGAAGNYNEAFQFNNTSILGNTSLVSSESVVLDDGGFGVFDTLSNLGGGIGSDLLPYDVTGNIRVLQVWWRSKRKILKVKSFDPVTGEEKFDFYPETYIPDTDAGEEATSLWINEMWEGTKIGDNIYCRIRPCIVQHNSISNPSRCHGGIVGTIYNVNEMKPFTLVDMMKRYSYLYDATSAKLIELIATNWGKLLEMDLALKPKDWKVEQWIYYARANKILIRDSFKEGDKGAATGKLAGGLNNASKGYIDADWGNSIQNYINLLEWIETSMSNVVGINRQRQGNTYNRETAGGIERAVLQSSYITDWLFQKHDDTKRRVLECFLEEAKAAIRGRSIKFEYILSDGSRRMMEIDGDEFSECSYGVVVDNSSDLQKFNAQIDAVAQAAAQNQAIDFASQLRLYASLSTSEKIEIVEEAERRMMQRAQQQREQEMQLEQMKIQADQQARMQEMQQKDILNQRDNDTKIEVARLNAQAEYLRLGIYENENNEELRREELQIDKDKLAAEIKKLDAEIRLKDKELDQKKEIELKKIAAQKSNKKQ